MWIINSYYIKEMLNYFFLQFYECYIHPLLTELISVSYYHAVDEIGHL